MTRYTKDANGNYIIKGKKFKSLEGSRSQVWHGNAYKTTGELTKDNLHMNKHGRVVSKKKFGTSKKENRLLKHGYGSRKGKFGYVKLNGTRRHRKHH